MVMLGNEICELKTPILQVFMSECPCWSNEHMAMTLPNYRPRKFLIPYERVNLPCMTKYLCGNMSDLLKFLPIIFSQFDQQNTKEKINPK